MFLNRSHVYVSFSVSGRTSYNYINGDLNTTTNQSYSLDLKILKIKKNVITVDASVAPAYNIYRYVLQPAYNNNSFGFGSRNDVLVFFPEKLQLNTTLDYTYAAKTPSLPATNYTVWNASFGRTFFKDDNLKVELSGNNILNQSRNSR